MISVVFLSHTLEYVYPYKFAKVKKKRDVFYIRYSEAGIWFIIVFNDVFVQLY